MSEGDLKMCYLIYAKTKEMRRFLPLDVDRGRFVSNKIYATLWFEDGKEEAYSTCEKLQAENPNVSFEVRFQH